MPLPANMTVYKPGSCETLSEDISVLPTDMMIMGQSGSGKTHLSITLSKYLPKTLPNDVVKNGLVKLHDLIVVGFDKDTAVTLRAQGLVPGYFIDVWRMQQAPTQEEMDRPGYKPRPVAITFEQALCWVEMEIEYAKKEDPRRTLISIDTSSALSDGLANYYLHVDPDKSNNNQKNYGRVNDRFYAFWRSISLLGFRAMWLMHPRENSDESSAKIEENVDKKKVQEARAMVKGTPGDNLIVPQMIGRSGMLVLGNSSAEFWLETVEQGEGRFKRTLHPYGRKCSGIQGKNRYHGIFPASMPADLAAVDALLLKKTGATC